MLTEPYSHQTEALERANGKAAFAYLMEMRTGKTRVVIEEAFELGIDTLVVVAPKGVHVNWGTEFETHAGDHEYVFHAWKGGTTKRETRRLDSLIQSKVLKVFTINWDALNSDKGFKTIAQFLETGTSMLVADEAHRMKTPGARRTKRMLKLSNLADYRRILTGTPVANNPLDIWAPFHFLDPDILGCKNFYVFRSIYAITQQRMLGNGRQFKEVVGYQRQDQLKSKIAEYSYSITAAECLELPPRQYVTLQTTLSKTQRRMYDDLSSELATKWEDQEMTTPIVLTQLLRFQQLVSGHFVPDGEDEPQYIGAENRERALLEYLEDIPGKVIIWCRFVAERWRLIELLSESYGSDTIVDCLDIEAGIEQFRTLPEVRFLIANPEGPAGEGRDFSMASTQIYYSNSFRLTTRLQSEARCDKKGRQGGPVTIVDIIAKDTVDEHIVDALWSKKDVAAGFTGKQLMEFI